MSILRYQVVAKIDGQPIDITYVQAFNRPQAISVLQAQGYYKEFDDCEITVDPYPDKPSLTNVLQLPLL